MIWRLVGSGLLLAYAAIAIGSGLDRLVPTAPDFARFVPGFLAADAHKAQAMAAIAHGDAGGGETAARLAVTRDPVDRRPAALLGAARWMAGDARGAEEAYRVAAEFGWRDPLTQRYWLEAAIEAGDYPLAAQRLDALLRADPETPDADRLLAPFESTQGGRAAMASRLALRPAWTDRYLSPGPDLPRAGLVARAETVAAFRKHGAQLNCEAVARFAQLLLQQGLRPSAERVWNTHCGGARLGGLSDPEFRRAGRGGFDDPFGWRAMQGGDLSVQPTAGGAGLIIASTSPARRLALSQLVTLRPGTYVILADVRGTNGKSAPGQTIASLDCAEQPRPPSSPQGDLAQEGQSILAGDCGRQVVGLWLLPGERTIEIRHIRLIRQ